MSSAELDADIIIGGTHYEAYLVRLERDESLSHPGSEVRLTMSSDFPHADIDPWDSLVIYEQGTLTLTGYVSDITPHRDPAYVEIKGQDTYKRAQDWFLPENVFTSGSQNVGYWVNYACHECGISYVINETTGSEIVLNPDIPFGMRYVSDVLVNLCAIAQWQMQIDASGVLQLRHIEHPDQPDYNFFNVEAYEFDSNDIDTRNSVKVWGYQNISGGSILLSDSRDVPGISDTRNMVFAEPNITNLQQAQSVANASLDQWAKIEEVISINGIGNPSIRAGNSLNVYTGHLTSGSHLDTITDMRSTLDVQGYNQSITAGRRAYRYPYWPVGPIPTTEILILLDNSCKVIYTVDWTSGSTSPTWYDHSTGLSGTPYQVFFDRSDGYRCFCMTSAGLFRVNDLFDNTESWELIYTPANVKVAIGTASACEMGWMGLDPRTSGRFVFTAGITGADKYVFYSVNGGYNITSGSSLDYSPPEPDEQVGGNISFGPSSTEGTLTYEYKQGGFNTRISRTFRANGAILGAPVGFNNPEFFNPDTPQFHQRSAYSSIILAWPSANADSQISRSTTSGGSTYTTIGISFQVKLTGQAVSFQRNANFAMAVDTSGSLHRSSNSGVTWNATNLASTGISVNAIINTIDSGNRWAVAGSSVKATTDFGVSWITKVGNLLGIVASPDIIWMDVYNTGVPV